MPDLPSLPGRGSRGTYPRRVRVLRVFHSAPVRAWRARERELRKLGHEIRLVAARSWDIGGSRVSLEPEPGEDVLPIRTWGRHPALFLYDPRPLWRELGCTWDVVDLHEEPFALATAEVLLIKMLRRNRAPYVLYSAQNIFKRYPVPFRWLERAALRRASAVIVCNREAGRVVERKGFPGRAQCIPLGVDTQLFRPRVRTAERGSTVTVGYVGRLEEHKGIRDLVEAVTVAPRLRLVVIGDGSLRSWLEDKAKLSGLAGRIKILGPMSPSLLAEAMASFDVLAVPSRTTPTWIEQFGRVVVEAMAAGVPVVATRTGALVDVVGDAGILVPERSPHDLAKALVAVGDDRVLSARLSERGLCRAAEWAWPAVARRYEQVYRLATHSSVSPSAGLKDPEVLVVAYGAPAILRQTLEPLAELPITVVDNSSLPEIRDLCSKLGVRYLDPGFNGGFAQGVNHGLRHRLYPDRDVLLLNPDAVIDPASLRVLHRALRSDPRCASAAPRQVDGSGEETRVAWPWPTPARAWLEAVGLGGFGQRADYVTGSVMLLRNEAINAVGEFDESFFLYAEEADWARRATRLGWRHLLVTSVTARHLGGATSTDSRRRLVHFSAGQERYYRKHFGAVGWHMARAAQLCGAVVRSLSRGDARARVPVLLIGPRRLERRYLAFEGVPIL